MPCVFDDAYLDEAIDCVHFGVLKALELVVCVAVFVEEEGWRRKSTALHLKATYVSEQKLTH